MRLAVRLAGGLIAALLVIAALIGWGLARYAAPGPLEKATVVVIPRGMGLGGIGNMLAAAGVVDHGFLFVLGARLTEPEGPLKAGEYAFPAAISLADVIDLLRSGHTVVHKLTLPEGLTSAQVVALVKAEPALSGDVPVVPPEGSLLPETYHYSYGDDRAQLIDRMRAAMAAATEELWAKRAEGLPITSLDQAVTLASIVEKETGIAAERSKVAGVFINRLSKGMRLQSDPTVIYALTSGAKPLDRSLTRADLKLDSPYNTYQVAGLPPGPIDNPGRAALAAVLHPDRTDYLYFVADGSGGHAFAKTLEDHNRNVAQWHKLHGEEPPPSGQDAP